jgi:hypothetical protein
MTIIELRKEVDEITRIFLSAKYCSQDFTYLHSIKYQNPLVNRTFYLFIERMFHSTCISLVLDLCKLFDKREKFSLIRLKNKMDDKYEKSELNSLIPKSEFVEIFNALNSDAIEVLLRKLKITRDEYYAHFDRTRTEFGKIQMNSKETSKLISIAENILKTIELKFFEVSVNFDLSIGELGHNIFERLNEWEKYREKYGLLKKYR